MDAILTPAETIELALEVNGEPVRRHVPVRRLLADFLRDDLGLTGTHVGCEQGVCGACTVLVDGAPARSCITLAAQVEGAEVTTVEGITPASGLGPLQEAFKEHHALQCGFCTPGFLMTISGVNPPDYPDDDSIRELLSGNLCRCTGYEHIVNATRAYFAQAGDPVAVALVELRARLRLGRATLRQDVPGPYPYPMTHEILGEGATSVADRVIDAGSSPTLSVILRERSLVVVDDCRTRAQEDPDFDDDGFRAMLDSYGGLASYVAVPIFDGARLHGVLALHHLGEPRSWTEEELELAAETGDRIRGLILATEEAKGVA